MQVSVVVYLVAEPVLVRTGLFSVSYDTVKLPLVASVVVTLMLLMLTSLLVRRNFRIPHRFWNWRELFSEVAYMGKPVNEPSTVTCSAGRVTLVAVMATEAG